MVQVLQTTQNLVISRCCFVEDGKEKCTKNYNARAHLLFCSLNLLFSDLPVAVAVVVFLNSLFLNLRPEGTAVNSISSIVSVNQMHVTQIDDTSNNTYMGLGSNCFSSKSCMKLSPKVKSRKKLKPVYTLSTG